MLKIINALNINKAHGHDDISIQMVKLCGKSVFKPLSMIFDNCIDAGTFPDIWKQSNIIPLHKKGDKQIADNYRPVFLFPIFWEIFENLLFNSIMDFLEENILLNSNQVSGQMTLVRVKFFQQSIFIHHSIATCHLKLEV